MANQTEAEHVLELSSELLDDVELGRLDSDKLLLKCSRLARLAGSEQTKTWIAYEMRGYNSTEQLSLLFMGHTGRWTDLEKKQGYWGPLAQQEALIEATKARLAATAIPDVSGEWANVAISNVIREQQSLALRLSKLGGIKSRVLALLHEFISAVYYERVFSQLAESAFEKHRRSIDALIAVHAGSVLSKIPSVMSRLSERDPEGVSQALNTCRRIIEAFADAIYPATDATIELDGNVLKLDASKYQNRLNAYVAERTKSASRRKRLRQNIANLYDRVSTGVHKEVSFEEAHSLFLNVYLFLGEVLELSADAQEIAVE